MTTKLMLTLLLAITSTQTTCDGLITGPSMFYGPDGKKHLYERTPSESKESIYCLVHNSVEEVYRLTPDLQEVEGGTEHIVHQVYEKLDLLDEDIMSFGHKLGDLEESGYVVKITVADGGDFKEAVYFVVPNNE